MPQTDMEKLQSGVADFLSKVPSIHPPERCHFELSGFLDKKLVGDFDSKLAGYTEICFYYNPGRFHALYRRLLEQTHLGDRVVRITHLWNIV